MRVFSEFRDFLKEYRILSLAVAFIIGAAATSLVQSLVNNIIMPFITPFMPRGAWEEATLSLGSVVLRWGQFASTLIYFIIIAVVVFLISKYFFKEEKVTKK